MIGVKAINKVTGEVIAMGVFDDMDEAKWNVTNNIEWDEDDIIEDWEFVYEELEDDYCDEPSYDLECGFDPYMGCYSDDC